MFFNFIFKFQVTFLLFIVFYQLFEYAEKGLIANLDAVGREFVTGEDSSITIFRETLNISYYLVIAFRGKM